MFRTAWEKRVTIIKPREDKGGHKCFCRVSRKKMPNCANTAEFRVGTSAGILCVQFHAHVISDVKTKISGRRRKRYFTATDRDGIRFADRKFVFQHPGLDVRQTDFQRGHCRLNVRWRDRDLEVSIVRERFETQSSDTESSQKEVCVEDEENWAQFRTLWHSIGKTWDLLDVVIDDDWLYSICQIRRKPGECSTRDAIHVLESVKKYAVVNCVKGSWKTQECQKRKSVSNILYSATCIKHSVWSTLHGAHSV